MALYSLYTLELIAILTLVLPIPKAFCQYSQNLVVPRIRCYTCSSDREPVCADPKKLTADMFQDCTGLPGDDHCLKIVGPGVIVARGCGGLKDSTNAAGEGCYMDGTTQTCMCNTEMCNAGHRHFVAVALLTVSALVTIRTFLL